MILEGQLAQSQGQVPPFILMPPPARTTNAPLLGNTFIQTRTHVFDADAVIEMYRVLVTGALPGLKLAMWKRQQFRAEGKQGRIEASLAALNAPQPIRLTAAQWKMLLEEIEEED